MSRAPRKFVVRPLDGSLYSAGVTPTDLILTFVTTPVQMAELRTSLPLVLIRLWLFCWFRQNGHSRASPAFWMVRALK